MAPPPPPRPIVRYLYTKLHFKGPKKSLPPLKVKIFIAHPFKWAALWVFPHKNNYIPQHLNNRCINSYYDNSFLTRHCSVITDCVGGPGRGGITKYLRIYIVQSLYGRNDGD